MDACLVPKVLDTQAHFSVAQAFRIDKTNSLMAFIESRSCSRVNLVLSIVSIAPKVFYFHGFYFHYRLL
jgi:hypothetical protein